MTVQDQNGTTSFHWEFVNYMEFIKLFIIKSPLIRWWSLTTNQQLSLNISFYSRFDILSGMRNLHTHSSPKMTQCGINASFQCANNWTTNGRVFFNFSSNNKCIAQVMLSWIIILIRIQVDYARLINYKGPFWNMSLWCRTCNVYNTLEESRLWLRTFIKHVTDFTTIDTSTCITTSVDLVGR